MKNRYYLKKIISIVIILIVLSVMHILMYNTFYPIKEIPKAVKGELNLSGWNLDGIIMLNGEWAFYPGELISSEETLLHTAQYIQVPRIWSKKTPYKQTSKGIGTYHLTMILPSSELSFSLKIQNIWMAHRVYINGKLMSEAGKIGIDKKSFVAKNTPYVINVGPASKLDITIQVANYIYYDGGIIQPILFGEEQQLNANDKLNYSLDMAAFFTLFTFALFHIYMHYLRRKDKTFLFSGLYLLAITFGLLTSGEKLLMRTFSEVPFEIIYKVQDFSLAIELIFLTQFVRSVEPMMFSRKKGILLIIPIMFYLLVIMLLPYEIYVNLKIGVAIYLGLLMIFIDIRLLILLFQHDSRELPLNEFIYIVISIILMTMTFINSVFFYSGIFHANIIGKITAWGFLTSINAFLASRFTNKVSEAEQLSYDLIHANYIKGEFLARISHEIKAPLQNIINIISYLLNDRRQRFSEEQRNNLEVVKNTSDKLSLLVNDLSDMIHLKNNSLRVNIQTYDIYPVVQLTIQLMVYDLQMKKITLKNNLKPYTFVKADELRLRQILHNLLSSMVKNTDAGSIFISGKKLKDNYEIHIAVTGLNVLKEEWNWIFQGLYQSEETDIISDEWTSLGLNISRQLALRMGGDILLLSSEEGKKITFVLKLPIGRRGRRLLAIRKEPFSNQNLLQKDEDMEKKAVILLVDDSYTNTHVMSIILQERYQIRTASNRIDALRILQDEKLDMVITDIMMPGMSGIEFIKHVRNTYSLIELPVIITTTRDNNADIELAYQVGASDYIMKPIKRDELLARVQVLFQLAEASKTALSSQRAFLQAQIKPHFIYNALNNIIALCYEDGEQAAKMLSSLSKYLRYIFQMEQIENKISLKQELDLISNYVQIETLRFGNRLIYTTDIDLNIDIEEYMLPALLIQPIVENAIRHGIFNKKGIGHVILKITQQTSTLQIIIEDDGVGMSTEKVELLLSNKLSSGIGIKNIRKRIEIDPKASFSITSELNQGTKCILNIKR